MPYTHTNRKNQTYTLYQGKTKTGKPKYYMAKKPSTAGTPLDTIPDGYEIRESPANGTPGVRKIRPCNFTPEELTLVRSAVEQNENVSKFIVDGDRDAITIYISQALIAASEFEEIFGTHLSVNDDWNHNANYSPEMRFILIDDQQRTFAAERWCYRGSIDDWFPIGLPGPLPQLVKQFTPHLGQESFYELM